MSKAESAVATTGTYQPDAERPLRLAGKGRMPAGVFLVMVVMFASGCGATRPSKYYQLALPSDLGSTKANDPLPVTLLVGRLRASHLYREDRIVYGAKGEEMGTYEYQRWTEPPTEMIEEMLMRELRAPGRYQGVSLLSSESRGDYLLRGSLQDFKEISDGALLARVTLDLELRETKTGSTVWTHYYTHDETVSGKDIAAVVAALNRNAQRGVDEVRVSLDEYFTSHSSK